jgi:predicted oxidoreductase
MKEAPLIVGTMRLGSWGVNFNTTQWIEFIEGCLEIGLHEFDHADIYGGHTTEEDFGRALKAQPSLRDQLHLTTKCGIIYPSDKHPEYGMKYYDSSKKHIVSSVENSLKALETDYIDQLLLHRPDYLMDPDAVAEAFEELQNAGKVREFGLSNFKPSQLAMIHDYVALASHQIQISLLHLDAFENGTLDQCMTRGITATAWSPLGGSKFFGKPDDARNLRIREMAEQIGENHDATFDEIMLAFLAKHPAKIRPVMGTTKIARLKSAMKAMQINLSREEWYMLWQSSTGKPMA